MLSIYVGVCGIWTGDYRDMSGSCSGRSGQVVVLSPKAFLWVIWFPSRNYDWVLRRFLGFLPICEHG